MAYRTMSVMTAPASADTTGKFADGDVDIALTCNDGFLELSANADRMMVDPHLPVSFPAALSDKPSEPTFAMSPSIWEQQLEASTPLFGQHRNDDESIGIKDNVNLVPIAPSKPLEPIAGRKSSRTSSNSSLPSLASSASSHDSQIKKRSRKPSRKKQQSALKQEPKSENKEEDFKRNKYLERNRLAASKCRQKKKEWVHDLEETKSILETKNHSLQREYSALLDEVSQMKNFLMAHSSCNDGNIDQWIEGEARRFAKKSMDGSFASLIPRPSGSISMPTSESCQSSRDSANAFSPTASSPTGFQLQAVPVKREEINFDHMPDDMFQ